MSPLLRLKPKPRLKTKGRDEPFVPWYFRREIVETYESWYTGKGARMDRLEKKLLRALLPELGEVRTLLEVGCGTTHFTRWFARELGLRAVGLDLSPLMLREARKWWDGPLVRGDAAALPFPDGAFDAVAMITCFEYMPEPLRVLQEAQRVARRGLLLGLMNRWSLSTLRRRLQELLGKNPFYQNAHFYSLPEILGLLRRAYGPGARITWSCTLFPPVVPLEAARVPFGSFLALAVRFPDSPIAGGAKDERRPHDA